MKELFKTLMSVCPGRLFLEIDNHKKFNESVEGHIQDDSTGEFKNLDQAVKDAMISNDTIIRVEAHPKEVLVSVIEYSHDIEDALKKALVSIEKAEQEADNNG